MSKFTRLLSGRKTQPKAQGRRTIRPQIEALEERALLTLFWRGSAIPLWSNPDNWYDPAVGARVPQANDDLVFPPNAAQFNSINNLSTLLPLNSIELTGTGYTIRGNAFQLGAGGMRQSAGVNNVISNDIALPTTRVFTVAAAGNLVLAGRLFGAGTVIKNGPGTLTFSQPSPTQLTPNTYTGTTRVDEGTLVLSKNAGVTAVPGTLVIGDNVGGANADVVRLSSSHQIADGASVTVNSSGRLDVNNQDEFITGLTMTSGRVDIGATGYLELRGNVTTNAAANTATISGGELFMAATSPTFTVANGTATVDLRVSAEINSFFRHPLAKAGTGRLTLTADNAFSGIMTVNAGILNIGNTGALGATGAGGETIVADGAALEVELPPQLTQATAISEPLSLNGTGIGGTGALVHVNQLTLPPPAPLRFFNVNWTGSITLRGTTGIGTVLGFDGFNQLELRGAIGQASGSVGGLTKLGPGLVRLTANNTYTGTTTVSAGPLLIDGSQSSSAVTVNGGFVGVSGTVGAVTVNGGQLSGTGTIGALTANSGGRVRLGSSTLTVNGDVTLNTGSILEVSFREPDVSGRLRLIGPPNRTVTINNATLDANINFAAAGGTAFTIIDNATTGAAATGIFNGIAPFPATFVVPGVDGAANQAFRMNYAGGDGNNVVATRNTPPMVQYIFLDPEVIYAGDYTYLYGQLTDPDAEAYLGLYISWGDGSEDQVEYPGLEPFVYWHQYATPGEYYVFTFWFDESGEGNFRYLPLVVLGGSAPGQGTPPPDDVRSLLPAVRADAAPVVHQAAPRAVPREMTMFRGTVTAEPAGADRQDSFSANPGRDRVTAMYDEAFLAVLLTDLDDILR